MPRGPRAHACDRCDGDDAWRPAAGEKVRREPLTWSSAACDLLAPATRSELSWAGYLGNADFWARTLQNWQSEFLAVGAMCVLCIYLRQRGSSQSKPVGEPHDSTGVEG